VHSARLRKRFRRHLSEWILIGVDDVTPWRKDPPDLKRLAGQIRPRSGEAHKSAWAHCPDNSRCHPHGLLRPAVLLGHRVHGAQKLARAVLRLAPRLTSRRLQALCLLLHRAGKQPMWAADIVFCLSINRGVLDPDAVAETAEQHIIQAYDATHRELTYSTENARNAAITTIFRGQHHAFRALDYTFDELRPLMTQLYEAGLLRPDFSAVARRLLTEAAGA
jgi:hypothetical protein